MDKASVFGTEDCRFESCRGHRFQHTMLLSSLWIVKLPPERLFGLVV